MSKAINPDDLTDEEFTALELSEIAWCRSPHSHAN